MIVEFCQTSMHRILKILFWLVSNKVSSTLTIINVLLVTQPQPCSIMYLFTQLLITGLICFTSQLRAQVIYKSKLYLRQSNEQFSLQIPGHDVTRFIMHLNFVLVLFFTYVMLWPWLLTMEGLGCYGHCNWDFKLTWYTHICPEMLVISCSSNFNIQHKVPLKVEAFAIYF